MHPVSGNVVPKNLSSTGHPERQRRDALFNVIVGQAGIPLLRPRSVKAAGEVAEVIRRLV
ncbi:TPA: hypothetical protein ACLGNK_004366 [Salmonella enterica]